MWMHINLAEAWYHVTRDGEQPKDINDHMNDDALYEDRGCAQFQTLLLVELRQRHNICLDKESPSMVDSFM